MKIVVDGFSKLFTVPLGAQFGKVWKILSDYLIDHNRTIVSAKLFADADAKPLAINKTTIEKFASTSTTDLFMLEIASIPMKYAIGQLIDSAKRLIHAIENDVYIPLIKLLEENPENRTDIIKTAILTNSKEQLQIFNELISTLYLLSKTSVETNNLFDVDKIENIYARAQNSIEHNDMSTVIQLVSVDMKQYLDTVLRKVDELKAPIS